MQARTRANVTKERHGILVKDLISRNFLNVNVNVNDQTVSGIYIILSNTSNGTAFLRQAVTNCGFRKLVQYVTINNNNNDGLLKIFKNSTLMVKYI